LQHVTSIDPVGNKKFVINLPEIVYHLESNSTEERDHWVNGLKEAIEIGTSLEKYVFPDQKFSFTIEESRREGRLFRKGVAGWKEVRIIVMDGMLYSYSLKSGNRKDKIALYGSRWEEVTEGEFAWKIVTVDALKIFLATSSEIEMHEWLNFLKKQTLMIEETINSIAFD